MQQGEGLFAFFVFSWCLRVFVVKKDHHGTKKCTKEEVQTVNRWLFKEEPTNFSYADLEKAGRTTWDGISNALRKKRLSAKWWCYKELQHKINPAKMLRWWLVQKVDSRDPSHLPQLRLIPLLRIGSW
jgi:hypothetical protein